MPRTNFSGDFEVTNFRGHFILKPRTAAGRHWVRDTIGIEDFDNWPGIAALEYSTLISLVKGLRSTGLTINEDELKQAWIEHQRPPRFSPQELEAEARRLEAEGNMPTLQEYLAALDATLEEMGLPVPGQPYFTPKDKRLLRHMGIADPQKKPAQLALNFSTGGES